MVRARSRSHLDASRRCTTRHEQAALQCRRLLLPRVGYFLFYRVAPRKQVIQILAFWHASRGSKPRLSRDTPKMVPSKVLRVGGVGFRHLPYLSSGSKAIRVASLSSAHNGWRLSGERIARVRCSRGLGGGRRSAAWSELLPSSAAIPYMSFPSELC